MIGAIAGDMIGSPYEHYPLKTLDFAPQVSDFTDDTVLTLAVADAILQGGDFAEFINSFARKYPALPYGGLFIRWVWSQETTPYNSFGNGSAMRVSPVGFAFDTMDDVLLYAKKSAEVTHNHPEGIKGAQATALAIFLSRQGKGKRTIRETIETRFGYNLQRTLAEIRPAYRFDVSCQGSVPESIIAFLESDDYISAVKNAISLGGDADTMACIAGAIAQAYYHKVPPEIISVVKKKLPPDLLAILDLFNDRYGCAY